MNAVLALSAALFVIGTLGVLVRRNAIIMFLCIELQLNAVNLALVAFSRAHGIDGQIFVFFVMTVAAAEATRRASAARACALSFIWAAERSPRRKPL